MLPKRRKDSNEDEVIIRHIDRDMAYESELIALEKEFWENHVQAKTPPPYIEDDGELILRSMRRCWGPSRMDAPPSELTQAGYDHVLRYLKLKEEKSGLDSRTNKLDKELERLKALIVADMGGSDSAVYSDESGSYTVTFRPGRREGIRKESLLRLKELRPEVYAEYVSVFESRRLSVKFAAAQAA